MVFIKRAIKCFFLMLTLNYIFLFNAVQFNIFIKICAGIFLFVFYIYYNFKPTNEDYPSKRLKILKNGYELVITASLCFVLEIIFYIYLILNFNSKSLLIFNGILNMVLIGIILINGLIRIFGASSQLGIALRISLIFLWWVPVVNIIILNKFCHVAGSEYKFSHSKHILNESRKEEEICRTKYPILMVHGIFFRDFKNFNYWGRIPNELIKNGATIYYGNQQSSSSVEESANELKQRILDILKETSCEKVNIIAHSKGGLDARYAISCLNMDKYVASLTTINTPHRGCNFAGKLIDKLPEKIISSLGKKYDSLYTKLGDESPDFFSGVSELTAEKCSELNKQMVDCRGVLYQSVGSQMGSALSSPFPLNAGYSIIKPLDGDNDGLVSTNSMVWGEFLGIIKPSGKQGISHGDMIDLMRKNIEGFDVCEFYVNLVKKLKDKGL